MRVWRLIVWGVSPEHSGLMARLKMTPARGKPTTFWRQYPEAARGQVENAISLLRAAGLHGKAIRAEKQAAAPRRKKFKLVPTREGFGGKLNARPIAGSWRMRKRKT